MFPLPGFFYPHSPFLVKLYVYYMYSFIFHVDNNVVCRKTRKNKKVSGKNKKSIEKFPKNAFYVHSTPSSYIPPVVIETFFAKALDKSENM